MIELKKLVIFHQTEKAEKGDDDIYSFTVINCIQTLSGVVRDRNGQAIADAKVQLFDSEYKVIDSIQSDGEGKYNFKSIVCESKLQGCRK